MTQGVGVSVTQGLGVWVTQGVGVSVTQGVGVSVTQGVGVSVTQGVGVSPPSPLSLQEIFCPAFTYVGMSLHPPPYSRGVKVGVGKPEILLVT